jgi:hypothetical protein
MQRVDFEITGLMLEHRILQIDLVQIGRHKRIRAFEISHQMICLLIDLF